MVKIRIGAVALDSDDTTVLSEFWREMLGGRIAFSSDDFTVVDAGPVWVTVHRVDDYQPPTWPDSAAPKQIHLDLAVDDLDAAEARALELGARKADAQPVPGRWRVLLDPAGHPFCVTTQIPA